MRKNYVGLGMLGLIVVAGYMGNSAAFSSEDESPTARPTARATEVAESGTPWQTFSDEVLDRNATLQRIMTEAATAAAEGDVDAMVDAMLDLKVMAADEQDWLDRHPPQDCYAPVHTSLGYALALYERAGELGAELDFENAKDRLDSGNAGMTEATAALGEVTCFD